MIKKLLSFTFAVILVFSLYSCSSEKEDGYPIAGIWKYELNEGKREAVTELIQDPRIYVDIYYEFNEDGTGRTYASDGSYDKSFTYTYSDGVITLTSDGYTFDQKCVLTDNTLTVHDDEQNEDITFKKQTAK